MKKKVSYHIRQAQACEAQYLTALAFRAKAHWGYPKEWLDLWREQLTITPEKINQSIAFVAEIDGKIKGFWCRSKVQSEEPSPGFLFIEPDAMRTGCAEQLWNEVRAALVQDGVQSFILEADPHAVPFYLKMGAKQIGEKESIIPGRMIPILRFDLK